MPRNIRQAAGIGSSPAERGLNRLRFLPLK